MANSFDLLGTIQEDDDNVEAIICMGAEVASADDNTMVTERLGEERNVQVSPTIEPLIFEPQTSGASRPSALVPATVGGDVSLVQVPHAVDDSSRVVSSEAVRDGVRGQTETVSSEQDLIGADGVASAWACTGEGPPPILGIGRVQYQLSPHGRYSPLVNVGTVGTVCQLSPPSEPAAPRDDETLSLDPCFSLPAPSIRISWLPADTTLHGNLPFSNTPDTSPCPTSTQIPTGLYTTYSYPHQSDPVDPDNHSSPSLPGPPPSSVSTRDNSSVVTNATPVEAYAPARSNAPVIRPFAPRPPLRIHPPPFSVEYGERFFNGLVTDAEDWEYDKMPHVCRSSSPHTPAPPSLEIVDGDVSPRPCDLLDKSNIAKGQESVLALASDGSHNPTVC